MDVPTAGPSQCVLGVTLPVPEPWAARIRLVRSDAGDPLALAVPPHITLLPPTLIELDALGAAVAHVRAIAGRTAPFVVELRGAGTFRPVSAVAYLALTRGAEDCAALEGALRAADGPLAVPVRFPFHPHVTLAHDVGDEALEAARTEAAGIEARFVVDRIHLHRLAPDATWTRLDAPPLRGPATPRRPVRTL